MKIDVRRVSASVGNFSSRANQHGRPHDNQQKRSIDREFEFYEFFSFLKFNEFYEFFFLLKKIRKKFLILQIIDV